MGLVNDGLTSVTLLVLIAGGVASLEARYREAPFFKYVPTPAAIYLACMVLAFLGLFSQSAEVSGAIVKVRALLFPAMVFLMLMRCDIGKLIDLGPRMLLGFFSATVTIMAGFVVMFAIMKGFFPEDSWKTWGALAGSWIGGEGNMLTLQGRLGITDADMLGTRTANDVASALWMILLFATVPFAKRFNKWAKSSTRFIDEIGGKLAIMDERAKARMQTSDFILLLGVALFASAVASEFAGIASPHLQEALGDNDIFSVGTLSVVIAALLGILASISSLARVPGSNPVSMSLFYVVVALTGAHARFGSMSEVPVYVLAGFMVLAFHAALMVLLAKVLRIDLFTCAVASLANIGAIVGAPVLAAAYRDSLVPIGILMTLMGYIVGTLGGSLVTNALSILGGA